MAARTDIRPRLALVAALCATVMVAMAFGAGDAGAAMKQPKPGKYAGKVGTFARIIFKVRGKLVFKLNAGVKTNCQRTSDGVITETRNLATAPAEQEPVAKLKLRKKKGRWVFNGKAQDKEGAEWKLSGRFVSRTKARGKFEMSKFETIFNPFLPFGTDGQLCAGSGNWVAKLKR